MRATAFFSGLTLSPALCSSLASVFADIQRSLAKLLPFSRKQILTDAADITAANVCDVLNKALYQHKQNQENIEHLWTTINHKILMRRL